jgi:3-oxoacyl-[acyl-carrier protein] reductase
MLLDGKVAVIYGGGGTIGGAVARTFATEGAQVFLAGRTQEPLDNVAQEIRGAGGSVETAIVDALNQEAVEAHADAVAASAGGIDVSFNLITHPHTHGVPVHEMDIDAYMAPVETAVRTLFLTVRAAARHMIPKGSGVFLAFGGPGERAAPMRDYNLGGTQLAFDAMESMRRQLSVELGPHGIRFVSLETGGIPETFPEDFEGRDAIIEEMDATTLLGRGATLEDVAESAAFAASDKARSMTAATLNVSAGALID